ncbi:hypothetical protein AB0M05_06180 [Streptomyces violaceusniger]|uniref:hypothetical protein n=1 Tax=Streptomyces violaceusniger TaxID=68280 RepID=UPI003439CCFE
MNRDLDRTLPRLPCDAEQIRTTRRFQAGGGKGAHRSLAARRLGADAPLLASVDRGAGHTLAGLATADVGPGALGVAPDAVIGRDHAATGTAVLLIAPDGNRIVVNAIDTAGAGEAILGAPPSSLTGALAVHPAA